jgi:predicted transcriptional regulator
MRDTAPQGTYKVQALDRAFAVLDLLGESETPLGLAQVASSLQLHKSTAHRFLMVLERHRMVERTANGKFRLGLRLFDFGNRAIEQYDLRDRAQPHLRRLVAETEETAHLCILEAARVIYIDKIEPARSVRMITRIGASNPVHCTSVGKAILAFLPEERAPIVLRRTPLRAFHASHHRHCRGTARGDGEDPPPRLRRGRRGLEGGIALHRRASARCAAAAGRGGEHLRAIVPRDRAEAAFDRQSSAPVRARHLDGYGLHVERTRQSGGLVRVGARHSFRYCASTGCIGT